MAEATCSHTTRRLRPHEKLFLQRHTAWYKLVDGVCGVQGANWAALVFAERQSCSLAMDLVVKRIPALNKYLKTGANPQPGRLRRAQMSACVMGRVLSDSRGRAPTPPFVCIQLLETARSLSLHALPISAHPHLARRVRCVPRDCTCQHAK